jgi:hypothetical protein
VDFDVLVFQDKLIAEDLKGLYVHAISESEHFLERSDLGQLEGLAVVGNVDLGA